MSRAARKTLSFEPRLCSLLVLLPLRVNALSRLIKFDLSDLGFVYGLLFALSLVLINPWATSFGGIWTTPKVYVLIFLVLLTWSVLFGLGIRNIWQKSSKQSADRPPSPWRWNVALGLWLAFLASGMVTVYLSPVTFRSALTAQNEMGNGWVYWAWSAALVCGNALVLRRYPQLFKAQLYGLLAGGVLSALAVFLQSVNWTLDFTATSGQVLGSSKMLRSGIPQGWMPIGLTSIRGHVGFIVAALAVLVLVCLVRGWLTKRVAWPLYAMFLACVYLTSTRGAQLAFVIGMLYLLVRFWRAAGGRRVVLLASYPSCWGACCSSRE